MASPKKHADWTRGACHRYTHQPAGLLCHVDLPCFSSLLLLVVLLLLLPFDINIVIIRIFRNPTINDLIIKNLKIGTIKFRLLFMEKMLKMFSCEIVYKISELLVRYNKNCNIFFKNRYAYLFSNKHIILYIFYNLRFLEYFLFENN